MLEHGLRRSGARVGTYTSPHLHALGERIRIDGRPIDDDELRRHVESVLALEREVAVELTFFEILTVAAVTSFAARPLDHWIVEAGLGGRWDATTALGARVHLFTRIGIDHEDMLGSGIPAIAGEKAAAITPGSRVCTVDQLPEAEAELRRVASERGATLERADPASHAPRNLPGEHQRANAGLALAGLACLGVAVSIDDLDETVWPGRLECIAVGRGSILLDVAHNEDGMRALVQHFRSDPPLEIVCGPRPDKGPERLRAILETLGCRVALVDHDPDPQAARTLVEDLVSRAAGGGTVLVCGSHVLVAAVRAPLLGLAEPADSGRLRDPAHRFFAGEGTGPLS
jgi:dihydrofolate synthase/folylpolyglutamate synthase